MSRLRAAAGALVRYPADRLRAAVIDASLLRIERGQPLEVCRPTMGLLAHGLSAEGVPEAMETCRR
ncbi:hypothetical protein [Microbulbifer sp. SAOS-129_SWC]|uniref:hypothetical protein n=1 Tax=Microbulbifer sp. SAOS-129_SWC TaxID=3145235 RepID=UPI003217BF4D